MTEYSAKMSRFFTGKCASARATKFAIYSLVACVWASQALLGTVAFSQEASAVPPRVARVQMKLVVDGEVVDVIEKGDLLTIVEEREENFLVRTYNGRKGVVAKANAVAIIESADIYTELIQAQPEEGRLYTLRAGAYWEAGKNEEALADFNKAIELGYDQTHAYVSRALFHAATGELGKAAADYTIAIKKEPEQFSHYINRAAVYMSQQKFDDAIADYNKAIELVPQNASIFQQRAVAHKAKLDLDAAVADFSKAIELEENHIAAIMGRGFVYFQRGDHGKAIDDFDRVIKLNPNAAVAYNNRGYNRQQLGDDTNALADYDKAIEIAPEYGLAHQNRAWVLATTTLDSLRMPDDAKASAEKACKFSDYQNPGDLAALAAAEAARGEFEAAIGWQEKVLQMVTPDQKDFAEAVLELYHDKKRYDAKEALKFVDAKRAADTESAASTNKSPAEKSPTDE